VGRIAVWLGWIPVALVLTPGWLAGGEHGGHRPDQTEVVTLAAVIVAVAGLVLGARHGTRTTPDAGVAAIGRRLAPLLAATAAVAVAYFAAGDAVFRWVIPLAEDLRGGPSWVPLIPIPVVTAALGFGAGLLRRRPAAAVPSRRWYQVAGAAALLGVYGVTGFVGHGAEMATARFVPERTTAATPVDLPAGRHAVYARYDDQPASCTVTGAGGAGIAVRQPSVRFTDNGDSVVTVLFGVFDLPRAGRVEVACPGGEIGDPPEVRGPLDRLLFVPVALLWLIGLAPAGLFALGVWLRRRRPRSGALAGAPSRSR
jgi:hypothetical protein